MDRASLLLSIQRALLGAVTPPLRSVSGDIDEKMRVVRLRFVYDDVAQEIDLEWASCAAGEVNDDFPDGWLIEEEYLNPDIPDESPWNGMRFAPDPCETGVFCQFVRC